MINFNKNPSTITKCVSSKRSSHKEAPLRLKKKLTKSNKDFLRLLGLLK